MDTSKLSVKLFLATSAPSTEAIVPVFHTWIQQNAVADHLLIDVADYAHVQNGPGTVLVADEGNIHIDHTGGRSGLLYVRKRPIAGSLEEKIRTVVRTAIDAAARLESTPALDGLKFKTDELQFRINDRLHAPATTETFQAVKPALEAVAREVFGNATVRLEAKLTDRTLFEVVITSAESPNLQKLQDRLAAKV